MFDFISHKTQGDEVDLRGGRRRNNSLCDTNINTTVILGACMHSNAYNFGFDWKTASTRATRICMVWVNVWECEVGTFSCGPPAGAQVGHDSVDALSLISIYFPVYSRMIKHINIISNFLAFQCSCAASFVNPLYFTLDRSPSKDFWQHTVVLSKIHQRWYCRCLAENIVVSNEILVLTSTWVQEGRLH